MIKSCCFQGDPIVSVGTSLLPFLVSPKLAVLIFFIMFFSGHNLFIRAARPSLSRTAAEGSLIGPHEDLMAIVKRHKLQWYGHVSRSSGLAKTILQGTAKGGRRQGRQRKRWEDSIREWTGLEFAKSQRAVENREQWRKLVTKSSVVAQRLSRLRDR